VAMDAEERHASERKWGARRLQRHATCRDC
jgi:hypothetical protein